MRTTISIVILACLLLAVIRICYADKNEATMYAQRDMLSLIKDGKGRITNDTIDIGQAEAMFDGDVKTLARSKSVNPFSTTLILDKPMEFDRVGIRTNDEEHEWTMEIAESEEDLAAKRKSYQKIVDNRHMKGESDSVLLEKKIKARAFRLTVKRLTGDDYVHIFEWEFPVKQKVKDVILQVLDYFLRDYPRLVEADELFENTVITIKTIAVLENDLRIDITPEVNMSVDGEPWMDMTGRYLMTKAGTANIVVKYGGFTRTNTLSVLKPMDFINGEYVDFSNNNTDLDVLFIERLPRLDYDGPNGGWPKDGSPVIWRAHVRNWGEEKFDKVSYRFYMNDKVVKEGFIENFGPETTCNVDFEWKWQKSRHRIEFEIDSENNINELSEFNNRIEDFTNALAVGFYVEEYLWRVAHEHQHELNIGSNSFEDWAQRHMRFWNRLHKEAIYSSTPNGVIDRVRLDKVVIVPNNSLPLAGGIVTNNPNNNDKTVDLIWGFESLDVCKRKKEITEGREEPGWRHTDLSSYENIAWGYPHELNHARYIIDHYGFDVHANQVKVLLDDGTPLPDSRYFPSGALYFNKYRGIMGGHHDVYDEYMALAWNRVTGKRARGGNYNSPEVIGEYLQLHPKRNTFTFVDADGGPLSGGDIWIYRTVGTGHGWYNKHYDNTVDLKFKLNEYGQADLPWTIFAEDGIIHHTYGNANSVVIVRVNHKGKVGFVFIECSDFNIEYMKGHTEHGHYLVTVKNLKELAKTQSKQAPSSQKP